MKTEKFYEHVCTMLRMYDNELGLNMADDCIKNPNKYVGIKSFPFYQMAAEMLLDAKTEMDVAHQKSKGKASTVVTAAKRIVSNAPEYQEALRGVFEQNGRYCICDGYRAVRMTEDLESLPHVETKNTIDLGAIFDKTTRDETFELPTVAEVKRFISEQKTKGVSPKIVVYNLIDDVWVNPNYLIDMLNLLPDCTAYKPANKYSTIYFESEHGDGVLLPVRHTA